MVPGDLLDCDPGIWMDLPVVLVVNDILVSPSSVATEFCDGASLGNDWELVEPQSSPLSFSPESVWTDSQEERSCEESPVKAPPASRRRMLPPTPQQSSHSSIEETKWQAEMVVQGRVLVKEQLLMLK